MEAGALFVLWGGGDRFFFPSRLMSEDSPMLLLLLVLLLVVLLLWAFRPRPMLFTPVDPAALSLSEPFLDEPLPACRAELLELPLAALLAEVLVEARGWVVEVTDVRPPFPEPGCMSGGRENNETSQERTCV